MKKYIFFFTCILLKIHSSEHLDFFNLYIGIEPINTLEKLDLSSDSCLSDLYKQIDSLFNLGKFKLKQDWM